MKINFIHIPKNGGTSIREVCYNTTKNKKRKSLLGNLVIYNYHNTDVYKKNLCNQLIVLRNPIERFISAVAYALQKWSNDIHVKYLIENKIDTPEKWVKIWMNPKDDNFSFLMNEIKNKEHRIGERVIEYKYTYSSQKSKGKKS